MTKDMQDCLKHGIKCYPVWFNNAWRVQVDNNGEIKTSNKIISKNKILQGVDCHDAIANTYKFFNDKLKKI